jgi:hypothetical protein
MEIVQLMPTIISCASLLLSTLIWKDKKELAKALALQNKSENIVNIVADHNIQLAVLENKLINLKENSQEFNDKLKEHSQEFNEKLDKILDELKEI